jgi:hypothetical protein
MKLIFIGWFCLVLSVVSAQNNSLILNGGYVVLKGNTISNPVYFVINQNSTSGIIRPGGGHIHSEDQYGFIKWIMGTGTGNYIFPFGISGFSADYIPFTFNKTTSGNSDIAVSTWATNIQNIPYPGTSNVTAVCCMNTCEVEPVNSAIDRFWDIRSSGNTTANLTFSYLGFENTTASPLGIFMAQHWDGVQWDSQKGPGNIGVTTGVGTVGPVIGQTTFSPWVITKVPAEVMATAYPSSICNGASSTLTGTGATSYSWSPASSLSSSTGASVIATPTETTIYTVTDTDENGCMNTATVTVTVNPLPNANAGLDKTVYRGYPPSQCAILNGLASGGAEPYQYSWSNGASTGNTSVCPTTTTTYTLTVTDANGCSKTDNVTVNVIDIRCGKNKVKVCHAKKTICIGITDVQFHLAHGDYLGACTNAVSFAENIDSSVIENNDAFLFYPNPTTGSFTIEVYKKDVVEGAIIQVVDFNGQIIYSKPPFRIEGHFKETIELNHALPEGIYFMNLIIGESVETKKLILTK